MTEQVRYVLCIRNAGYPASLELHRVYRAISAAKRRPPLKLPGSPVSEILIAQRKRVSDEQGRQLHDRATRGEPLSANERELLEAWYLLLDRDERERLGLATTEADEETAWGRSDGWAFSCGGPVGHQATSPRLVRRRMPARPPGDWYRRIVSIRLSSSACSWS